MAAPLPRPAAIGLNAAMPVLTRRRNPDRADCWRIYYGDDNKTSGDHIRARHMEAAVA